MSQAEKANEPNKLDEDPNLAKDAVEEAATEGPQMWSGLRDRVRKLLNNAQERGPLAKQELAKNRTRSLVLLIGGTVGAVLLFAQWSLLRGGR